MAPLAKNQAAVADAKIEVRECVSIEDFEQCMALQREVFSFADMEVSPRRHFIVSKQAGGWALGAFVENELIGFVHQLIALEGREVYGYSHMLAVKAGFQNKGVGARLKWAQRARSLVEGRKLIRWTWDPMQARNAHFNLNRLGVIVRSYAVNFYGTDYNAPAARMEQAPGIDSDRLFAEWQLDSEGVKLLSQGKQPELKDGPAAEIVIPPNWSALVKQDADAARREQLKVRAEFVQAFSDGLICKKFAPDATRPRYLLYKE